MFTIEPYYSKDYTELFDFLIDFNPNIDTTTWAKLLNYKWENDLGYKGMMLKSEGKIVGFLCYIISQSKIGTEKINSCNISSWFVYPEYRAKSLQLLSPLFKIKNVLILNLSPHKNTLSIFDTLRFNKLSEYEYIANPYKAIIKGSLELKKTLYKINEKTGENNNLDCYSETELVFIKDLESYSNVTTFCVEIKENENTHKLKLVFNKRRLTTPDLKAKIKELSYSIIGRKYQYELLYVSSSSLLITNLQNILYSFLIRSDVRNISISEHFLQKKDPNLNFISKVYRERPWYIYSDTEIDESQVNILFTEKVLLNF